MIYYFFLLLFLYTTMRISLIISFDSKSGNGDTVHTEQPRRRILAMFTAHKIHKPIVK